MGSCWRQRQREDPRLLPCLRNAGLPSLRAMPELTAVAAGSLDDLGRFTPQVLTYRVRGPA